MAFFAGYGGAPSIPSCPDARAPASMWHAGPRIGDGYRKLSLTPAGVPNESWRLSFKYPPGGCRPPAAGGLLALAGWRLAGGGGS